MTSTSRQRDINALPNNTTSSAVIVVKAAADIAHTGSIKVKTKNKRNFIQRIYTSNNRKRYDI